MWILCCIFHPSLGKYFTVIAHGNYVELLLNFQWFQEVIVKQESSTFSKAPGTRPSPGSTPSSPMSSAGWCLTFFSA